MVEAPALRRLQLGQALRETAAEIRHRILFSLLMKRVHSFMVVTKFACIRSSEGGVSSCTRFPQLCAARIPSAPPWIPCINREKLKPYRSDPVGSRIGSRAQIRAGLEREANFTHCVLVGSRRIPHRIPLIYQEAFSETYISGCHPGF